MRINEDRLNIWWLSHPISKKWQWFISVGSLIDSGPQLSRQLLGCIPAHRPIYIQHGLHKTIGIPLVRCTLALPIPTRRVGIVLEYDNNHTYSIVHARKRHLSHRDRSTRCSQFPIFNCKPFQLNTCLYRQSLQFFPPSFPVAATSWSQALQYAREHMHMLA